MKAVELVFESMKSNHALVMEKMGNNHALLLDAMSNSTRFEDGLLIGVGIIFIVVLSISFRMNAVITSMNFNKELTKETLTTIKDSNRDVSKAIVTLTEIVRDIERRGKR